MLVAGASLLALLSPAGLADRFTTFDFGESSTPVSFGTFDAEHDVQTVSGTINLYSSGTLSGGADVVGRIGATYRLNAGDLLSPFQAFTTASGTAVGELTCVNITPGTEASLRLSLQKWHQVDGNWILEQTAFVDEWQCPLVTLVDFEPFSGGAAFSYDPGETYRLVVEALARSRATSGSQAVTDFCDSNAFDCGALTIPGHILLSLIEIPNQRPVALFHDTEVWYVDALLNGAVVTGRGCDIDGTVEDLTIGVTELLTETTTPIGGICGEGQHIVVPPAPGTFTGHATSRDDEDSTGSDVGVFRVTLLPTGALAADLPDLGSFAPHSEARLRAWFGPAGQLVGYGLDVDGRLAAQSLGDVTLAVHEASVTYDLVRAQASVVLDGRERWAGPVLPAVDSRGWWDVEPVPLPRVALG